jgi:hypothetical protein
MRFREPIRVAVVFGPGHSIRPVWFDRQRLKHTIREITYTWEERRGASRVLHFAVRDEGGLYELSYDTCQLTWELHGIEEE